MGLNFQVAESWNGLNEYQLKNISYLLLTKGSIDSYSELKNKLLYYLFVPKLSFRNYRRFRRLVSEVPIRELDSYISFIESSITRTRFIPVLKIGGNTFYGPADRLANLTIEEFAAADLFFYNWKSKDSLTDLDRLITILYRERAEIPSSTDIRKVYSKFDLIERGKVIPKLDVKTKMAIGLTYLSCRNLIVKKYPVVFSKNRVEEKRKKKYQSFSGVIISMCMDEIQPLGDYERVKDTLVDEFFSLLSESILIQKRRQRELDKSRNKR